MDLKKLLEEEVDYNTVETDISEPLQIGVDFPKGGIDTLASDIENEAKSRRESSDYVPLKELMANAGYNEDGTKIDNNREVAADEMDGMGGDAGDVEAPQAPEAPKAPQTENIKAMMEKLNKQKLKEKAAENAKKAKDSLSEDDKKSGVNWWDVIGGVADTLHNASARRSNFRTSKERKIKDPSKYRQEQLKEKMDKLKIKERERDIANVDSDVKYKVAGNSIFKIAPGKAPEFMAKDPSAATEAEKEFDKKMVGDLMDQSKFESKAGEKSQLIDETIRTYQEVLRNAGRSDLLERFTLGAYTALEGGDRQKLESQFNKLDIEDMVQTFAGMSKAVDSDTEQARWQATVANLRKGQPANMDILLRGKEIALRFKQHLKDKRRYLVKNRTFVGYEPKRYSVVYAPSGESMVVPKGQEPAYKKNGYMSREDFSKKDFRKIKYAGGIADVETIRNNTIEGVLKENVERLKKKGVELTPEKMQRLRKKVEEKLEAAGKI